MIAATLALSALGFMGFVGCLICINLHNHALDSIGKRLDLQSERIDQLASRVNGRPIPGNGRERNP